MCHHIKPDSVDTYLSGICHQLKPYFPHVHEIRKSKLAQLNHFPDKSGDLPKTETWLSFANKQTPNNKIFPPSDQLRQQRLPPLLTPASYP